MASAVSWSHQQNSWSLEGMERECLVAQEFRFMIQKHEWDLWSDLSQNIWGHSCTRTGDQVVVAGGVSLSFNIIPTTYILDLNTREEKVVGDLIGARAWFGMATLSDRVLAFGGMSPLKDQFNDIQELG